MRCLHKPLRIVQGDTFDLEVNVCNHFEEEVVIDSVHFDCTSLNIHKDLIPANDEESIWFMSLTSEETSILRVGSFTYDITAVLENGAETSTLVHNAMIEVQFKVNKCVNK